MDGRSKSSAKAKQILQTVGTTLGGSPAKLVVDAVTKLVDISEILNEKRTMWTEFSDHVQEHIACLLSVMSKTTSQPPDVRRQLEQLQTAMEGLLAEATEYQNQMMVDRIAALRVEADKIRSLRDKFDRAINNFNFKIGIAGLADRMDVAVVLESVKDVSRVVPDLAAKVEDLDSRWHDGPDAVHYLPYAVGMSWDLEKICMDGTRTDVLTEAWDWVRSGETAKQAEILWIVDVAGSGKSAIAHTICQQAKEAGVLLSCFFFDHADANKNHPDRVVTTLARDLAALDDRVAAIMSDVLKANPGLRSASIRRQFEDLILNPDAIAHYPRDRLFLIMFDGLDEGYNSTIIKLFVSDVARLPGKFRIVITSRPEQKIVQEFRNVPHIRERRLQLRQAPNREDISSYISTRLTSVASVHRKDSFWPGHTKKTQLIEKSEGLFLWASVVMDVLTDCVDPDAELASVISLPGSSSPEHAMDTLYSKVLNALPWTTDRPFADGYRIYMGTVLAAQQPLSCSALRHLHTELPTTQPSAIFTKLGSLVTGVESEDEPVRLLHESLRDFLSRAEETQFHVSQLAASDMLALRCLEVLNRDLPSREAELQLDSLPGEDKLGVRLLSRQQVGDGLYYACCYCIYHLVKITQLTRGLKTALQQFLATNFLRWMDLSVFLGKIQSLQTLGAWLETQFGRLNPPGRFARLLSHITFRGSKDPNIGRHVYNVELAVTLRQISEGLYARDRLEEALTAAQDGTHILQHPFVMRSRDAEVEVGRLLATESRCLLAMGRMEEALTKSQDAEKIHRELWRKHFYLKEVLQTWHLRPGTARSPVDGRDDEGRLNAAILKTDLARSLNNVSVCLSDLGNREAALSAIEEAVQLYRELATKCPEAFNPDLAGSLTNLSGRLSEHGNREAALSTIEEAVKLYRELATKRPEAFNARLATALNTQSSCLSELGNREAALSAIEEAVKLYREVATKRPEAFNADLAMALNNLSAHLSALGNREAALSAIEEAVKLYRELATKRPEAFNRDLAGSLNNLSNRLSELGHIEASLSAIEEAVKLYRELATKRPEAFNGRLAMALNNLSGRLGNQEAALIAIEEAVTRYQELATKRPEAFNADLAASLNNLSERLSALGNREAALGAIEESVKVYRELATKQPEAFNAVLARSLNNLSNQLSALGNREAALSAIEDAVKLYRDLATKRPEAFDADLAMSLNNLSNRLSELGNRQAALSAIEEAVKLCLELVTKRPAVFIAYLALSLNNLSICLSNLGRPEDALSPSEEATMISRALATMRPHVFNRHLKRQLQQLSLVKAALGEVEEARAATREAEALDVS